jgi:HK97 family phage prohead protease
MTKMETRTFTVDDIEVREAADGMTFEGYAAVFNSPSEPLPFTETIAPGAFSRTIRSRNNIFLLVNHDPARPLASTRSKTMSLEEDSRGLLVKATLPDTTDGRDLAVLLGAGGKHPRVIDSMSFGFSVPRGGDSWSEDGSQRTLNQVRLHETSIVAFPAYGATSASVRSLDMLAEKTGEDADALNGALEALERGATLTLDQAGLLSAVVAKLAPAPEPTPEPEPEAVADDTDLLRTKLDLAFKAL